MEGGTGGAAKIVRADRDDGTQHDVSVEGMKNLKLAFKEGRSGTAGNDSQLSDIAAATRLMRRSTADESVLLSSIIDEWVSTYTVSRQPEKIGVRPMAAIPRLLEVTQFKTEEVVIWEIKVAVASQTL